MHLIFWIWTLILWPVWTCVVLAHRSFAYKLISRMSPTLDTQCPCNHMSIPLCLPCMHTCHVHVCPCPFHKPPWLVTMLPWSTLRRKEEEEENINKYQIFKVLYCVLLTMSCLPSWLHPSHLPQVSPIIPTFCTCSHLSILLFLFLF